MDQSIAIVGMACRYPGASNPAELWENVLAGRRAFRRMPAERLRLEDYFSPDKDKPDSIYSSEACVIEGYEFDRARFRVGKTAYNSADLAHWLALDIAAQALEDAGYTTDNRMADLPRLTTGVYVGNTLTGEFSRSNTLRLRWPYVRRVLHAALSQEDLSIEQRIELLTRLEQLYKQPFPIPNDETLAGNLSNTIAGRICNYFDFKGGGYSVDGACASSLLAVSTACAALASGDVTVALAGGVDLSMDPFELVGFAKTAALAQDTMRVFDRRSAGFLPGEGCGFVVLMPLEAARRQQLRVYAIIRGWGTSSDGSGGITRPEVEGQMLALERAYRRAGYRADTVSYFEAHGTGTSVGDETELRALRGCREGDGQDDHKTDAEPDLKGCPALALEAAAIGSIKANIGHTKAAAGIAGLIKAAMALDRQIIPPTTGCQQPHALLVDSESSITSIRKGKLWPLNKPPRAGVSAMGFGGINCHVALESASTDQRRGELTRQEEILLSSEQDAELFLMAAESPAGLLDQTGRLLSYSARLSRSDLTDLAGEMQRCLTPDGSGIRAAWRAAIIASSPVELTKGLETLGARLADGSGSPRLDLKAGLFAGDSSGLRIGFLFPGQGSPVYFDGGALGRRFAEVDELYSSLDRPPKDADKLATETAQPAIVAGCLAGLRLMRTFGIEASVAVGHSLGEVIALNWAGCFDESTALEIAAARSAAMSQPGVSTGAMAAIRAERSQVQTLLNGDPISIACLNGPKNTVVSGTSEAISAFAARASAAGVAAYTLPVSRPFHSPLIAPAADLLRSSLPTERFSAAGKPVISTVTGSAISAGEDLSDLLCHQITAPVRFIEAATAARELADFFVEVGPGSAISGLMAEITDQPVMSLDVGGDSIRGLLQVVAAAFVSGVSTNYSALFESRFTRPFNLDWRPCFFRNPCEMAPLLGEKVQAQPTRPAAIDSTRATIDAGTEGPLPILPVPDASEVDITEMIRRLIAERAELPYESVNSRDRMLADLHFNSLTVSRIIVEASRQLGLPPPVAPTDYANVTVADMAAALEEARATLNRSGQTQPGSDRYPTGIESWVRSLTVDLIEEALPPPTAMTQDDEPGNWKLFVNSEHPLAKTLVAALPTFPGNGVLAALSPKAEETEIELLLNAAKQAIFAKQSKCKFVLLQHGRSAAGLARTLHLEQPDISVCVVDAPWGDPRIVERVRSEAKAASGYTEAHYDPDGTRRVPVLTLPWHGDHSQSGSGISLGPGDRILVTGGGKGIAAECALDLARTSGATVILLGRSNRDKDPDLDKNLKRFASLGVSFRYLAVDVTDAGAVGAALAPVTKELGPITCVLHGAGRNEPALLASLTAEEFGATLAPKVHGLQNVLAAIDPRHLKVLVGFGSLIARSGMPGEAHYAVANERLRELIEAWRIDHCDCRCLTMEWSVWAGAGMGERLGTIDRLAQQGISAISIEDGVGSLRRLLATPNCPATVISTGRFGSLPTMRLAESTLPFHRFLEEPRVYYPGIELVVDCELSAQTDPYLNEHVFDGNRLFPAVLGLEAMAQVAMAVTKNEQAPRFEDATFSRPIALPENGSVIIRIAGLVTAADTVQLAIRSEETGFQVDHFRATCRFKEASDDAFNGDTDGAVADNSFADTDNFPALDLDPERELYGNLLFHQGRFRRVRGYRKITSTGCVAEVGVSKRTRWFSQFLPACLVLGDPAQRDAVIHAIQVCVPDSTLLPVGVERITIADVEPKEGADGGSGESPSQEVACLVIATETARVGDVFTYDVLVTDSRGRQLEQWKGLKLRMVTRSNPERCGSGPLLGPYMERVVRDKMDAPWLSVAVSRRTADLSRDSDRTWFTDAVICRALGSSEAILRRPDGKPHTAGGKSVSASHSNGLTLAVAELAPPDRWGRRGRNGSGVCVGRLLACDAETVVCQPKPIWKDLLGAQRYELAETLSSGTATHLGSESNAGSNGRGESHTNNRNDAKRENSFDLAATRVWCAVECMKKAGLPVDGPLVIDSDSDDGWVDLRTGNSRIATFAACLMGGDVMQVFAILV